MPLYSYKAIAIDGAKQKGRIEAANAEQLAALLRDQDLFLTESAQTESRTAQVKLKTMEIADFCRQLAAMLSSGITLIRAMMILSQRDLKPHVKKVYDSLIEDLQRGSTLSEAMSMRGRSFPELLINMMRAGEQTGRMDVTALKMAETYDKEHRLNQKIRSATMYPIILVVLIIGVVLVIFTFVLPRFMEMFEGMELPLPTRIVMGISGFLTSYGAILAVGVVILVALLIYLFRQPGPRIALDKFKLRIPKIGKLLSTIYTARFARTLASLYVSGIPMIQALNIARDTIGNKYIESQFVQVIDHLGNGRTLSQSIAGVDGFENKLKSTIMIGEESGRLEQMLDSVADQFDYDSEMASQRMVSLIEPVLIVVMAGVVGVVIISVMLPIYQMYSNVGAEGGL
ncbi:MAG: type II secretion system F family protein [Clostridiales Family XIII bacterium]|jgi:type IV pilus assembly protein PilC|nr:type II secretion system F family protein [Clostridiales Family XIII bacterium]